jgi:hypothetical protein
MPIDGVSWRVIHAGVDDIHSHEILARWHLFGYLEDELYHFSTVRGLAIQVNHLHEGAATDHSMAATSPIAHRL